MSLFWKCAHKWKPRIEKNKSTSKNHPECHNETLDIYTFLRSLLGVGFHIPICLPGVFHCAPRFPLQLLLCPGVEEGPENSCPSLLRALSTRHAVLSFKVEQEGCTAQSDALVRASLGIPGSWVTRLASPISRCTIAFFSLNLGVYKIFTYSLKGTAHTQTTFVY